jgi:hypothetical protein
VRYNAPYDKHFLKQKKERTMKIFNTLLISIALILCATAIQANDQNSDSNETGTFTLNLWAPGVEAPEGAKYAEWGDLYQYQYNPETVTFTDNDSVKTLQFRFHADLADRYQFRWVTASEPQSVTLAKMKTDKMDIKVDGYSSDMYFEVWVLDTLTGKVFMADPRVIVGGGE